MKSPLQALIQMGVVPTVTFPADSRYYGTSTLTYITPTGDTIAYLARRIVPQPGAPNFATVAQHTVHSGDRLDIIAAKYLGRPAHLLVNLRCQRSHHAARPGRYAGDSIEHHHATGRAGGAKCSITFTSAFSSGPLSRSRLRAR